jgi:tetratricopeptide (TPR) repeat protein
MWIGCALALAVVLLIRWRALGALAIQEEFVAQGIRGLSATARAWTMIGLWPLVVTLLIWPAHLSMYYGPDVVTAHTASDWQHVLVLGGVALVLLGASALARRGDRRPLAALLWITIAYLPASNLLIPTGQLLAERTLYLPSVGVMMLVAWVIDQAWRVLERSASTQRVRIAIIAPVLLVATLGGIRSHMGARSWRSDEALFRSGIASAPNASHPHYLLGDWYAKRGDQEHALPLFARAYELEPANTRLLFVYARQLRASGQQDSALAVLRDAARRESDSWSRRMLYLTNLGEIRGPDSLIAEARLISTSDTAGLYRQTRLLVGAYEEKGMTDSALHILARGAVALPHYGLLQLLYAQALQAHGDDAGAERRLALAERDPSVRRYDVALLRAKIALARADTSAAAHAILSAHEAAPRDTALARLAREVRAPSVSRATPSTSSAGGRE